MTTNRRKTASARDAKVERPHAYFNNPADVLLDPDLSREERTRALDALEQDARQLAVASNEGMRNGEPDHLRAARVAKSALKLPPADRALLAAEQCLDALLPETVGTKAHLPVRKAIEALNTARSAVAELADARR